MKRLLLAVALGVGAWLPACASDAPAQVDLSTRPDMVQVLVLGDGFVKSDGRRIPLEGLVYELRQRVRSLSTPDRQRFVVGVDVDVEGGGVARDAARRLVDELRIMGVGHIRYL